MIELGCNFSVELLDLLDQKRALVDWIKLANEHLYNEQYNAIKTLKPGLFHIVPNVLSNGHLDGWNIDRINKAISDCCSPHVGVHLYARKDTLKGEVTRESLKTLTLHKISQWKQKIKSPYLIENMPITCLAEGYEHLADPEFLREICNEGNIGLLLDLSHLKISAWYRGESEESYLERLPLELVREIHVNGPSIKGTDYLDTHMAMRKEDFDFLDYTLSFTKPKIVTLEYGSQRNDETNQQLLEVQLIQLREILAKY